MTYIKKGKPALTIIEALLRGGLVTEISEWEGDWTKEPEEYGTFSFEIKNVSGQLTAVPTRAKSDKGDGKVISNSCDEYKLEVLPHYFIFKIVGLHQELYPFAKKIVVVPPSLEGVLYTTFVSLG